ncbi:hypothetical protein LTS18_012480, partial [Coniosporium uncinatum]
GNQSITKYFEDEKDILSDGEEGRDMSSHSSDDKENEDPDKEATPTPTPATPTAHYGGGVGGAADIPADDGPASAAMAPTINYPGKQAFGIPDIIETVEQRKQPRKEKKRPRDRILRDPVMGRAALDVRKRRAFLGYTYRRPNVWMMEEEQRGRKAGRASVLPGVGGEIFGGGREGY